MDSLTARSCAKTMCQHPDCRDCFPVKDFGGAEELQPGDVIPVDKPGEKPSFVTHYEERAARMGSRPPPYGPTYAERFGQDEKPTNPKDAIAAGAGPLDLLPDTAVIAGNMALAEGALKYGRYNWRVAGVRASVYATACRSHMMKWLNGQDIDPDSGLDELWKALACIAILIDAKECGKLVDDRAPYAPINAMRERVKADFARLKEQYGDRNPKQYTIADSPAPEGA